MGIEHKTIVICDKCEKDMSGEGDAVRKAMHLVTPAYFFFLCSSCLKEFKKFMKND